MVHRKHKEQLRFWFTLFVIAAFLFIYSVKKEIFYLTISSLIIGGVSSVFVALTLDKIHK